jgi:hypothetical protein
VWSIRAQRRVAVPLIAILFVEAWEAMPLKKGRLAVNALRISILMMSPIALASFSGVTVLITSIRPAISDGTMYSGTVRPLSSTPDTIARSTVVRLYVEERPRSTGKRGSP